MALAPEIYMELGTEQSVILDIDLKNLGEDVHQSGLLMVLPDEVQSGFAKMLQKLAKLTCLTPKIPEMTFFDPKYYFK